MTAIETALKGKKTYIVGILWVIVAIAQGDASYDPEVAKGVLEGTALMTFRAALAKLK